MTFISDRTPAPTTASHFPTDDRREEVEREVLRDALQEGLVVAHYQPKIDLRTGECESVEALARWREPGAHLIPPSRFVAVAERERLIDDLTHRMLAVVLKDLVDWERADFRPKVAINVSAQSLARHGFSDGLLKQVQRAGVAPSRLILEVTESAIANDPISALGSMGRLRLCGFGLSIDDYGTGFSSLQLLVRLPFSELKIDRSVISGVHANPHQRTILASAIDVGRRLGRRTVAEGIENTAELATVVALGCDSGQGHLFARPMVPDTLLHWREADAERTAALCREARAR